MKQEEYVKAMASVRCPKLLGIGYFIAAGICFLPGLWLDAKVADAIAHFYLMAMILVGATTKDWLHLTTSTLITDKIVTFNKECASMVLQLERQVAKLDERLVRIESASSNAASDAHAIREYIAWKISGSEAEQVLKRSGEPMCT